MSTIKGGSVIGPTTGPAERITLSWGEFVAVPFNEVHVDDRGMRTYHSAWMNVWGPMKNSPAWTRANQVVPWGTVFAFPVKPGSVHVTVHVVEEALSYEARRRYVQEHGNAARAWREKLMRIPSAPPPKAIEALLDEQRGDPVVPEPESEEDNPARFRRRRATSQDTDADDYQHHVIKPNDPDVWWPRCGACHKRLCQGRRCMFCEAMVHHHCPCVCDLEEGYVPESDAVAASRNKKAQSIAKYNKWIASLATTRQTRRLL